MNILVVTQYFYPEDFKVNDIVFDLKKRGHEITVFTSKPNYPKGRFFKGYNFWNRTVEYIDGVKVVRVPTIPRLNGGAFGLILNYLSFLFFSRLLLPFKVRDEHDVIFIQELSPITSCLPGLWIKKRFNTPIVLWVLDLWPESFYANSSIRLKPIVNWVERTCNKVYNRSNQILVSSNSFINPIKARLTSEKRMNYFPNWAEDHFNTPLEKDFVLPWSFPEGFNIVFTGNIGESQGFEDVVEAASKTNSQNINWIIIGAGRKEEWVRLKTNELDLKRVFLPGRFPLETMPYFLAKADGLLITLKQDDVFSNTLPAKFQSYLTAGKPILGNFSGEGNQLVKEFDLGYATDPGNGDKLASLAIELSNLSACRRVEIGSNCRKLYAEKFAKEKTLNFLEQELIKYTR